MNLMRLSAHISKITRDGNILIYLRNTQVVYTCNFIVIMLTFYHVYILLLLLSNTYVFV